MKVQYVLHLLLCGLQDDIRLRAIHSVIESDQFLQSLLVFDPSSCSVLQALVERKPHLSQSPTGKVNWVQIWRSRRPGSGPPTSGNPSLRQPHCECVVALCHVEKQHLVCTEVPAHKTLLPVE
jgi:hypothetical protein